ncbi:MAG TPA: methyltransferase domain-containing protein [Candidatus Paceibacterota bacterium]|nr:methyltransferase domain-containing protein [Candidatus Paceibacterota bacterium]
MEGNPDSQKENLQSIYATRQEAERGAHISDWGLARYQEVLGIDVAEMKGKLVLDIGSGKSEKFSKEAAKIGIKVVSMSPHLKNKDAALTDEFLQDWQKSSVAGKAQEMPFIDDTFDYEVALYSVPYYLPFNQEEYKIFFKEVIRTLKPGGSAYFAPIFKNKTIENDFVPRKFISEVLKQFSDITYKIEKLNDADKEYRLVLKRTYF